MKTFVLFLLALSTATAVVQLNNLSYMKFADCKTGSTNMFMDNAFKATFDPILKLLYVTGNRCIRVINVDTPASPTVEHTHEFADANDGKLVDVAVCGNTVAVLFESTYELTEGHVYLCDRYDSVNKELKCDRFERITVGESPKSMTFTNDCSRLLVANEGRAGLVNGILTDPDGTVSIIDMTFTDSTSSCTKELSTHFFNYRVADYLDRGVRWTYRGNHNNNILTLFSQDLEPEQIAVSDDGKWAYVTMPENNAMGVIDMENEEWHDLFSLENKTWSQLSIDASDADTGAVLGTNYEVYGLYQATAAVFVRTSPTNAYVVTANTGAPRMYTETNEGVNFTDSIKALDALNQNLIDQAVISSDLAYNLATTNHLGNVQMSNMDGRSDISRLITKVYLFGGRDIGFWDTDTNKFGSTTGDDLERLAKDFYPEVFNGDCSNETSTPRSEMDSRSTLMGPEPNVLATGMFDSRILVTAATRNGLIYVYSFSINTPIFESVHRIGDMNLAWDLTQSDGLISDMGFMALNGNTYLFVVSKGTGSVSIKQFENIL